MSKRPTRRAVDLAAQRMHDARKKYGNHDAATARAEIAYWEAKEAWEAHRNKQNASK